jgi:hypothetical protein
LLRRAIDASWMMSQLQRHLPKIMRKTALVALTLCIALSSAPTATRATGEVTTVGPADNWCAAINAAVPGAEIALAPGTYTTPCVIRARGTSAQPVLIRSQSEAAGQRATFAYGGTASNVIDLDNVAHVTLRGFAFTRTEDDIDAIRIRSGDYITIERSEFTDIGGIAIPANTVGATYRRLVVRDNRFVSMRNTVIYFGCHDGNCTVADALVERNLIDGTLPGDGVGYGAQFKLNAQGVMRDNTIYRTSGPGLMVYGSNTGQPSSVIEGNYVEAARDDANINAGGGPVIVRNNVVVGGGFGGIRAQNYGGRNLQRDVRIVHNTVLSVTTQGGILVQGWTLASSTGNVLANNAIVSSTLPATSGSTGNAIVSGNIACAASCFVNAASAPFKPWPAADSPLIDAGGAGQPWQASDDFFGLPRSPASDIGAFERGAAQIDVPLGAGQARPARTPPTPTASPGPTSTPQTLTRTVFLPFARR